MKIIPVKTEYNVEVLGHTAKASLEHIDGKREIKYIFDDKLIGERTVEEGDLITDDDCIADILSEYSRTNTGVYADIYRNHADKLRLIDKIIIVKIDTGSFVVEMYVKCEKGLYSFSMTTNGGKDKVACRMEANDFSEAYEKARLIMYGLENINAEISKHINELANDQIMEIIKW